MIINTPYGPGSRGDGYCCAPRPYARGVTCVTAMSAANTYVGAIEGVREEQQGHGSANDMGMDVIALQDLPQHTVWSSCPAGAGEGRVSPRPGCNRVAQGGNSAPLAPKDALCLDGLHLLFLEINTI